MSGDERYVYMDHKDNVKDFYSSKQGEVLHIPCKRTHPNVNVSLNIVRQWASKEWADDNSKVIRLKAKKEMTKSKLLMKCQTGFVVGSGFQLVIQ